MWLIGYGLSIQLQFMPIHGGNYARHCLSMRKTGPTINSDSAAPMRKQMAELSQYTGGQILNGRKAHRTVILYAIRARGEGMTSFRISATNLEKWMAQNKAEYTGDFIDGALLDSFMLACKRGCAAVYEHYLNCWCSDYIVEFEAGEARTVWKNWHKFEEAKQQD